MGNPRLINKEQAKSLADAGGVTGGMDSVAGMVLAYAKNSRAMVAIVGTDPVCPGTDTKMTRGKYQ